MRYTRINRRRRRFGLFAYVAGGGFVLWIGAVVVLALFAGGSGGSSGEARPSDQEGVGSGSSTPEGPSEPGGGGLGRAEKGEGSRSDSGAEPGAPGDGEYAEVDRGGEEKPAEPSGTRLPRAAAGDGPPPYDPLGTGADAGTLSETDLSRARLAAFRFVDAAYDFEGEGPADRLLYLEGVNRTVDAPEFWKSPASPGSDPAEAVAARTAEYGVQNDAVFGDFRVEETSQERVVGTVAFKLDEGTDEKRYEQRLVLRRWAAVWRVLYAKPLEEVS